MLSNLHNRSETFEDGAVAYRGPRRLSAGPSLIAADLAIVGDLDCGDEIHIHGAIEGTIVCPVVVVAEGGFVDGTILAQTVRIAGEVTGTIEAVTVHIASTAAVNGKVFHHELTIEPGAFVEGRRPWRPRAHIEDRLPW